MKRILSMFVILALVIACLPVFPLEVHAVTIASGECGDNATWTLDDAGTLTISGTGPMDDCYQYTTGSGGNSVIARPWRQYSDQVKYAVIEEGVTYIGANAFLQDSNLKSVKIADSVTKIGDFAFKECSSLTSISFGSGLIKTGTDVFLRCTSLKNVVLPDCDVDYGNNLFTDCTSLTSVTIPVTQTVLGGSMFSGCTSLTNIDIPNSVTKIKGSAFQGTGLKSVYIPESVTFIDQYAFRYCENLKEVVIPSSVKSLGIGVFNNCLNLKELTLFEGVETIDGYLIANSPNVTEITIPSTVTALTNTFSEAYGLKVVKFRGNYPQCTGNVFGNCELTAYYPENNSTWTEDVRKNYGGKITWVPYYTEQPSKPKSGKAGENVTWTIHDDGTLVFSGWGPTDDNIQGITKAWCSYHSESIKHIVFEEGITYIGSYLFQGGIGLKQLESLTIPSSVRVIADYAFAGMTGYLKKVYIRDLAQWCHIDFLGDSPLSCFADLYVNGERVETLTIPSSVRKVPNYAFLGCTSITTLVIPKNVKEIGAAAFSSCSNLKKVVFQGDAPAADEWSFAQTTPCIYYPANNATWTEEVIAAFRTDATWIPYDPKTDDVLSDDFNGGETQENTSWYFDTENNTLYITGTGEMKDYVYPSVAPWSALWSIVERIIIREGVTSISPRAFANFNVREIRFPSTLRSIGDGSFDGCIKIRSIYFKGNAQSFETSYGKPFDAFYITAYYPAEDPTWTKEAMSQYGNYMTWVALEKGQLILNNEEFEEQDTVWIEGLPYPVEDNGVSRYVALPTEDDCYMVTYTYHVGDANDVHTQYPTGMKVYKVSDGQITYIPELDNLLQYSGASIRITGKKGIRMITSLNKETKNALTGKGLAGFKLLEYGTALCFAHEIPQGDALVLGRDFTRSNYAYKKGVADPVFASTKDLIQYTNVLVGFSLDQCKDDIAMRPYIILEDAAGNQITLYGGTIYRSIGYIAYQNRTVFKPQTASYNYVWEIIHHVYGDKYDADYKG